MTRATHCAVFRPRSGLAGNLIRPLRTAGVSHLSGDPRDTGIGSR